MLVKGHSGFKVELIDATTIRKSSPAGQGARLRKQIEKQIAFSRDARFKRILAPNVLREQEDADGYQADMEFIAADDFVEFLLEAGRDDLDDFIEEMVDFLRVNLAESKSTDVAEALHRKLDDLAAHGVPASYIEGARALCRGEVIVPVGPCHGDLTLSNMLFKRHRLYLIDFLDGFVETPLQDLVKLRQDTRFFWSLQRYPGEFDATKIQLTLGYLDRGLAAAFAPDVWCQQHYDLFQRINLMRILPYCREEETRAFVLRCLERQVAAG